MIVAGIDPGKGGCMVILHPDGTPVVCRVPLQRVKGKEKPAWTAWAQEWSIALAFNMPDRVVIESVAARPGQGVTSMFSFGVTLGMARGIVMSSCYGAEWWEPTPVAWKGVMGLRNSDKNASREKARQLLPKLAGHLSRVKDDGVAEAALLALYGRSR